MLSGGLHSPTPLLLARQACIGLSSLLAATMSSSSKSTRPSVSTDWTVKQYNPRHTAWPYKARDFTRQDESSDTDFYSSPRFVTHIDDHAIQALTGYYENVLPQHGKILDFCSSWISHYPHRIEKAVKDREVEVYGMGMNYAELDANPILGNKEKTSTRMIMDLNQTPDISGTAGERVEFDAATCVVSIDYLAKPLEVLSSLRRRMRDNGVVHLAISNRAFWHKVVRRWTEVGEEERLMMVADYLHFSGWRNVEIVTLLENEPKTSKMGMVDMLGMSHDPLWVVRGTK